MKTRVGLVAPFDTQSEEEFLRWAPPGVSLHWTRTPFKDGPISVELAAATADLEDLAVGVRSLTKIEPAVVTFACTSGSFVNGVAGERILRETMLAAGAQRAVTTSGGLLEALEVLGVRRVALATPYTSDIGDRLVAFVEEAGYEAVSVVNLELHDGLDIAAVGTSAIEHLATSAMRPEAEAIFLSCTGLETFDAIPVLEARLGVPVISAIQVTMWATLLAAQVGLPDYPQTLFQARPARSLAN